MNKGWPNGVVSGGAMEGSGAADGGGEGAAAAIGFGRIKDWRVKGK